MLTIYRYFQILLLLLICLPSVSGQEYYNIPLSSAKYFDNNITYSAAIDTTDILWVGTDKGLYRFDGGQSINAKLILKGWSELSNAFINKIECDKYNKLWINTKTQGVAVIDLNTMQCTRIALTNKIGAKILDYNLQSLVIDDRYAYASLWTSSDINGGLLKIDLTKYTTNITELTNVIVPGKLHIDKADNDYIWITGESLTKYDTRTDKYTEIEYDNTINAEHLVSITENGRGQLFIVFKKITNNRRTKILLYNKEKNIWLSNDTVDELDYSINYIKMYNDSLLLITTSDDIQYEMYDTYNNIMVDWDLKDDMLRSEGSITKLKNGDMVISGRNTNYLKQTQNAYGIIPIEPSTNSEISNYGNGHYLGDQYVFPKIGHRSYYLAIDTNSLIVTQKNIDKQYDYRAFYKIDNKKSLAVARDAIVTIDHSTGSVTLLKSIEEYIPDEKSTKVFYNSCVDINKNIWISTSHNSVLKYSVSSGKITDYKMPSYDKEASIYVFDITADSIGNIYAAGRYEVFYKGVSEETFTPLKEKFKNIELPANLIPFSISSTKKNEIILGTWAKGAYKINTTTSKVLRIGPQINNNPITCIRPLTNNKFSLLANDYLAIYNSINDEYKILMKKDGVTTLPLRNPATIKIREREAISFNGTFRTFNVDSLLHGRNQKIFISRFAANGITHTINDNISLNHNENNIEINYALSEYDIYNQVRYRYALYPNNNEWVDVDSKKELMFTNMDPGQYSLRLQSTNIDGFWIENITTTNFEIAPPWFGTLWFKALLALLMITIIGSFIKFYIKYQKRNLEYEKRFAQLETMILKSQMNPHFIFNSLNSIRYLFMKDQKDKGLKYITKFAKLLRSTLHHGEHSLVRLSEEIELTELFIDLEQLRFEGKFEYIANFESNEEWKNLKIPPFVIQPLVENAFWHGLSQSTSAEKTLKIKIEKSESDWLIHVEDNGVGMGNSKSSDDMIVGKKKSYGLSLIKERFELINKTQNIQYYIDIKSNNESSGTNITIRIKPIS